MKRRQEPVGAGSGFLRWFSSQESKERSPLSGEESPVPGRGGSCVARCLGIGLAAVWACVLTLHAAGSFWIDKQVVVQPIQMGSSDGSAWANIDLSIYEAESDKIWAQAGIDIKFLSAVQYQNSTYLDISSSPWSANSLLSLAGGSGHAQHPDPTVINLYFVRTIDLSTSVYGYSLQTTAAYGMVFPQNGVSIANSAFGYASGNGMRDIFAYELARNLGLDNDTLGAPSDPMNLMKTSGPYPTSLDDIFPTGAGYGHLTPEQIAMARSTTFASDLAPGDQYSYYDEIPEPASAAAVSAGLLALWALVRRRSARQ